MPIIVAAAVSFAPIIPPAFLEEEMLPLFVQFSTVITLHCPTIPPAAFSPVAVTAPEFSQPIIFSLPDSSPDHP